MAKVNLEDIVSLCKRRGFIYQGSEIYGGLAGTWDYGPLGAQLKRNIVNEWLKFFVDGWDDMYLIDTTIIMNPKVWEASGHLDTKLIKISAQIAAKPIPLVNHGNLT